MGNITGINTAIELGFEGATWGQAVTPTFKIKHISESLTWDPEYKEEETLIGNVTAEDSDLVGCTVAGDLVLWARPGVAGKLLAAALGQDSAAVNDGATAAYKHTITCLPPGVNNSLPSLTAIIDRHVAVKTYTGLKIGSVKIESAPKDFVKLTLSVKGKNETAGALENLTPSALKAYKFADGVVTVDGAGFSGNVKGFSISVENNLDEGDPSMESGIYNTEFETQKRKISINLDVVFNTDVESFRESKYKGGAYANIELTLTSPHEVEDGQPYKLTIKLPRVRITKANPNAGDSNKIKVSVDGEAYETTGTQPITIECINADDTAYV